MPITAITFDMWDTLVLDDSDEPERARRGLAPKAMARRALFVDLLRASSKLPDSALDEAWDVAEARFRHQWKVDHRTPCVADRLQVALDHLGLSRPAGFDDVVAALESMEVDIPPQPVPGIDKALDQLAAHHRLGMISDAIVTPGRGLREILDQHGLRRYFSHFVFSDEAGASKPAPRVFQLAAEGLGAPLRAMAHVGDRESNDIEGPLAVGMKAILFTAAVDRGSAASRASAVCRSAALLPDVVAALDRF